MLVKMRGLLLVAVVTALVLGLAGAGANTASADKGTGGAPRETTLSGAEEVPGPGDPDGVGFASVTLNVGQGRVCWRILRNLIAPPTAAHIHVGPAGVAGPIVVPLGPFIPSGCTTASPALIQAIIDSPENYYVNVHNAEFPAGAIRGQLSNRGQSD